MNFTAYLPGKVRPGSYCLECVGQELLLSTRVKISDREDDCHDRPGRGNGDHRGDDHGNDGGPGNGGSGSSDDFATLARTGLFGHDDGAHRRVEGRGAARWGIAHIRGAPSGGRYTARVTAPVPNVNLTLPEANAMSASLPQCRCEHPAVARSLRSSR